MADTTKNEIEEINERIAELQAQKAAIERRGREQAEAERKKKEKECEKDFQEIQEKIGEFNKKYSKEVILATTYKLRDDWSRPTLLPPFLRGLI